MHLFLDFSACKKQPFKEKDKLLNRERERYRSEKKRELEKERHGERVR